jgi:sulfur-oxidizing protein SoxA
LKVLALLLFTALAHGGEIPLGERRSGYEFMSRETRAMQDDETTNPALFTLMEGEALFKGNCAQCHADMKGVATRYPAVKAGKLVNLEQQINVCRTERQKAPAFAYESRELLALSSYVGRQSRWPPMKNILLPDGRSSSGARASSTLRAANATTTTGARASPAPPFRRLIRPGTRSIA